MVSLLCAKSFDSPISVHVNYEEHAYKNYNMFCCFMFRGRQQEVPQWYQIILCILYIALISTLLISALCIQSALFFIWLAWESHKTNCPLGCIYKWPVLFALWFYLAAWVLLFFKTLAGGTSDTVLFTSYICMYILCSCVSKAILYTKQNHRGQLKRLFSGLWNLLLFWVWMLM